MDISVSGSLSDIASLPSVPSVSSLTGSLGSSLPSIPSVSSLAGSLTSLPSLGSAIGVGSSLLGASKSLGNLTSLGGSLLNIGSLASLGSMLLGFLSGGLKWGIFYASGAPALQPDTFLGIDFKDNCVVSSFPQEQGSFASYNKVETPYDARIRMAIGRDSASRSQFITQLRILKLDLAMLTIVTPEVTYKNATIESSSYRRTAENGGKSMIIAEIVIKEVRLIAGKDNNFAPQQAASSSLVSGGLTQLKDAGSSLLSSASSAVSNATSSVTGLFA